ncbi:hypothetical protein Tco_1270272, partial [Tanacetum coccineum]
MSSITAQQTKLDLELVPKEKRLEIRKCNGRLNHRKKQIEPTFQVVLDALALTPFRMDKKNKFDLNLEIFGDIFQICLRVHGQNFDALPTNEDIVSFFKELGHTREIKTITDIFKKPASPKLTTVPASLKEPTRKLKRVKRPAKKSSDVPTVGVVIRETPVKSLSKKKEKMTCEEVRKKSLRDFNKTHPSGSGTVTKIAPSAAKIKPSITNEGTGVKSGVPDVTEEESTKSEAKSWERDEDDNNKDHDSRSK